MARLGYPRGMPQIIETAQRTAAAHNMLSSDTPVLVMVSGGADSVGLLHVLASGAFGERPLRVLHVNHMLRGETADADEAFVSALCERLGVELRVARYDVGAYAEAEGLNLEDAGRRIRYRFADAEIDSLCEANRVSPLRGRIAVAHTLDDRIETFFARAICGAGTGALSSIAATRGRIIRPLLDCGREDLRQWLTASGETWREDESNTDTTRQRAFVRSEILPAAQRLNPAFRATMARTMDLLGDDDALLAGMADAFARDFAQVRDGRIEFGREWMRTLDRTMARRTVRSAIAKAFPEATRLEAVHVEAIVDGFADDSFARDLPYGMRAETEYDTIVVSRRGEDVLRVAPGLLVLSGNAELGAAGRMSLRRVEGMDDTTSPDAAVIDEALVAGELSVDSYRPGDRMRPLGMGGSRKLSDLLVDAKVPKRLRHAHPVVRDGERIVWLAGVRLSDEYRVTEGTTCFLQLEWERGPAFGEDIHVGSD